MGCGKPNPLDNGFNINIRSTLIMQGGGYVPQGPSKTMQIGMIIGGLLGTAGNVASILLASKNGVNPSTIGNGYSIFGNGFNTGFSTAGFNSSYSALNNSSPGVVYKSAPDTTVKSNDNNKKNDDDKKIDNNKKNDDDDKKIDNNKKNDDDDKKIDNNKKNDDDDKKIDNNKKNDDDKKIDNNKKNDGDKKAPTAEEFNNFVNGDGSGIITGHTSNNVSHNTGVDNVVAGKANKTNHSVTTDETKASNGYLQSFTIKDKSGNIYTLIDPQVSNGKLTYKLDKNNSDLSADDKSGTQNYELNKAYNSETRLEIEIKDGKLIVHNESGIALATQNI